jgi:hypothetical protein
MVSGSLDGRTPPANAEVLMAQLNNGAHIVVEGAGHGGDILSRGETRAMVLSFLAGQSVPSARVGFRCEKKAPETAKLSREQLSACAGTYALPRGDAKLEVFGGILRASYGDKIMPLYPRSETEFFNEDRGIVLHFKFNEDGVATGFSTKMNGEMVYVDKLR